MSSGDIATGVVASAEVKDTFNPVSSLLDAVDKEFVIGGDTYKQPFVKSYAEGDYTAEGESYKDGEPIIKYATIAKTFVTAFITSMSLTASMIASRTY